MGGGPLRGPRGGWARGYQEDRPASLAQLFAIRGNHHVAAGEYCGTGVLVSGPRGRYLRSPQIGGTDTPAPRAHGGPRAPPVGDTRSLRQLQSLLAIGLRMPDKLLAFPDDVAVGSIWIEPGGLRIEARGAVRIPDGSVAHFSPDSPVRGLSLLPADAFHVVYPPKKRATDEDLQRISHLTGIRELHLSKAYDVTDRGVAALAGMTQMRSLDLYSTSITDAALASLVRMTHLEYLHVGLTRLKGPGLVHLAALQRLEWLSVEDTDIGDECLGPLEGLRSLKKLALWGTRVSTGGLARIQNALPNTSIVMRDPGRRLAAERSTHAILRILLRRMRPELPLDVDPQEHLPALLEKGALQWRSAEGIVGRPFVWDPNDAPMHARLLAICAAYGGDYRLITPDGPEPWFPWLRRRGAERRRHTLRRWRVRES